MTAIAMVAFAANSLLCRLALAPELIDAASFTTVRVASGALTLCLIVLIRRKPRSRKPRSRKPRNRTGLNWRSASMLFTYMAFFSFAYLSLSAGTGALILFGAVQLTMFIVALREGEHFPFISWIGFVLAFAGLIYLVFPGVTAPDPLGAALMAVAGIAWGTYSLLGRGVSHPLEATAENFVYSVPLVLIVSLIFLPAFSVSTEGLALAVASGAITSGCGYVIWYAALPGLTATRAATVQLSVPVIAAFGGVLLISEEITLRLLLASAATLGGLAIVMAQGRTKSSPPSEKSANRD
jgi:drug/metabolite transporter (DMT)-like permease